MTSQYRKGRRYEYEIAKKLREFGWTVWRLAGSKPVDLIAFRGKEERIIECKNYYNLKAADFEHCDKICKKVRRPIYLVKPSQKENEQPIIVVWSLIEDKIYTHLAFFEEVFI